MNRQQQQAIEYLQEEVRVLKELHGNKRLKFTDRQRARLARKGKRLSWSLLNKAAMLVTPQTILKWHRMLIGQKHYSPHKTKLSPRAEKMRKVRELSVKMASENAGWGYRRIQGVLKTLGLKVSHVTVYNVLKRSGLDPAPKRDQLSNWQTFIQSHLDVLGATDFFSVHVWTLRGLVQYSIHFVMDVGTRRVQITRIAPQWDGSIMENIARGLTDYETGFFRNIRYLIMDKDPLYTKAFREILKSSGINIVKLAPSTPYLNAYAERFVQSIKSECLDHLILIGEKSLHRAVSQFLEHYHEERPHQGLGNNLIEFPEQPLNPDKHGLIQTRERLGGLLKLYHWAPDPKEVEEVCHVA